MIAAVPVPRVSTDELAADVELRDLYRSERRSLVRLASLLLPTRQQECVVLRYYCDLSQPPRPSLGGAIDGVDESIAVEVHQLSSEGPIGRQCCIPAGNTGVPWQTTVAFAGAHDRVLTVSASTGGHLKAVERFVVTGVRLTS